MGSPTPVNQTARRAATGQDAALFISDLHLTQERPEAVSLFHRFLDEVAVTAGHLYILGDFLEAWIGDDDLSDPFNQSLVQALRTLADQGVKIAFLPGNRDFLAGEGFAGAAGLVILPDPVCINLFGTPTLLSHGDLFCSDDKAYQAFRSQTRDPAWQSDFLDKPLNERRNIARMLREQSEAAKAGKKPDIMDINEATLLAHLAQSKAKRVIHGHTHRPARHTHILDGEQVERWVLPDWYEAGGYLRCDGTGCRAFSFP